MLDADAIINNLSQKVGGSIMPIWTQLLKKWVGLDPEKHIGSAPLLMVAEKMTSSRNAIAQWEFHRNKHVSSRQISVFYQSFGRGLSVLFCQFMNHLVFKFKY